MPEQVIKCERTIEAPVDQVWSCVGDFWGEWHPAIKTSKRVVQASGTESRCFDSTDGGEYVETLTYFSESDRTFNYTLVSGIDGVESYVGHVQSTASDEDETRIQWSAKIVAGAKLLEGVSNGSAAVFEAGFDWLQRADLTKLRPKSARQKRHIAPTLERVTLSADPKLSILCTQAKTSNTLVLFLHGIGGNAENWLPQLEALGAAYNLSALDIRGYGESDLGENATTVEDHCNDILKAMRHVGARKLILVGLSMGSWIATSFAMRYPRSLAGLVLAGGCTGMSEAAAEVRDNFRRSRSQPILAGKTPSDIAGDVLDVICGPNASDFARKTLLDSMSGISSATYLDALNYFSRPTETFDFSKIDCPVLMMTGEHDCLAPPDEIRGVSLRIFEEMIHPDVRFEVLPGAGHVCNLESPETFNTLLERFLDRFGSAQTPLSVVNKTNKREAKKARIIKAALSEFSVGGFDGASMNAIAKSAEVSKPTLYQYYGDKDGLFAAVLEDGRSQILTPLAMGRGSLVEQLWGFSWTYAEFVLRPEILSLARLILGEAERRPESAEAYHRAGPGRALAGLVEFMKAKEVEGKLVFEDAELVAQDLWSLILSAPRDHHLHFVGAKPDPLELLRSIAHGLGVFLKAYSANLDSDQNELTKLVKLKREELS